MARRGERKKMLSGNETLYALLKFFVRLNIFAIPLYFIILTGYQSKPLIDITTSLAFGLVRLSGMHAELVGDTISVPVEGGYWGAYVSWDSTGWKSALAFTALVFATDFSLRKKLIALLFVPVIYAANVLRIWFMFFSVSQYGVSAFPLLHTTVWSWGLIAVVLALWVIWMKFAGEKGLRFIRKENK